MKRVFLYFLVVSLFLVSCDKAEDAVVFSNELKLSVKSGGDGVYLDWSRLRVDMFVSYTVQWSVNHNDDYYNYWNDAVEITDYEITSYQLNNLPFADSIYFRIQIKYYQDNYTYSRYSNVELYVNADNFTFSFTPENVLLAPESDLAIIVSSDGYYGNKRISQFDYKNTRVLNSIIVNVESADNLKIVQYNGNDEIVVTGSNQVNIYNVLSLELVKQINFPSAVYGCTTDNNGNLLFSNYDGIYLVSRSSGTLLHSIYNYDSKSITYLKSEDCFVVFSWYSAKKYKVNASNQLEELVYVNDYFNGYGNGVLTNEVGNYFLLPYYGDIYDAEFNKVSNLSEIYSSGYYFNNYCIVFSDEKIFSGMRNYSNNMITSSDFPDLGNRKYYNTYGSIKDFFVSSDTIYAITQHQLYDGWYSDYVYSFEKLPINN